MIQYFSTNLLSNWPEAPLRTNFHATNKGVSGGSVPPSKFQKSVSQEGICLTDSRREKSLKILNPNYFSHYKSTKLQKLTNSETEKEKKIK
jgi:hypothetical protein